MTRSVGSFTLPPAALLLDRDGTLVVDVPYNADPSLVRALPGVAAALERCRAAGVRLAVVSNQRGVARGLISPAELAAVNARVDELLGPFDAFLCCPHDASEGCDCRKPEPGLVVEAARRLAVPVESCALVGDSMSDVDAARRAGADAILLGPPGTDKDVATCPDLPSAIDLLLTNGVVA